jgi:hypothetical protein
MKWTYSIKNKLTAAIVLFLLCLIVLVNNIHDRQNQGEVKQAMNAMFEDRLVAETYILKLSLSMHQIREAISDPALGPEEENAAIARIMSEVRIINAGYENTKFTEAEMTKYLEFKTLCAQLGDNSGEFGPVQKRQISQEALAKLNTLSGIQLSESKLIIANSEKIFSFGTVSSKFETAIVVIIALVLQVLVFSSRTTRSMIRPVDPQLN